ncbi:MAG: PAS domain-containing protein [Candidatus Marinimicrobia bacterium]|nr:PAS domain-containing protein [Candidatus Neomarinimicrobiota bacterium]
MAANNTNPNIKPAPVDKQTQVEIARLQKLVDRYEQILNSASEGIIYASRAGMVLNANQKLHKIIKIPANKLIGKNVFILIKQYIQPKQTKIIIKLVEAALAGKQIKTFELNYQDRILEIAARIEPKFNGVISDNIDISLEQANPNGMVVSELITNTFKQGFKNRNQRTIEIPLIKEEQGYV